MRTTNLNLVTNSGKNYRLSRVNVFFSAVTICARSSQFSRLMRIKCTKPTLTFRNSDVEEGTRKLDQGIWNQFSELKKPFYN